MTRKITTKSKGNDYGTIKTTLIKSVVFNKYSPAVPSTAGFDPAYAGGLPPNDFALPDGYRVLALRRRIPFIKVLAQNPESVSRTRQVRRHNTIDQLESNFYIGYVRELGQETRRHRRRILGWHPTLASVSRTHLSSFRPAVYVSCQLDKT